MKIHVGVISHREGTNLYAGETRDAVLAQIAEFCRTWWDTEGPQAPEPTANEAVVEAYFTHQCEYSTGEDFEIEEVELK